MPSPRWPARRLTGRTRGGWINRQLLVILASLVVLGLLVASLLNLGPSAGQSSVGREAGTKGQPLVIYCAASNKSVMEAIRADYERQYKTPLQIQYGPSQTLLAAIEISGTGDLYLPADDSYLTMARERNLLADEFPLANMQAVVAVAKGNPKRIERLSDLLRDDVRVAQASFEGAAIGKLTREVLSARGEWDALHAHTTVYKTSVNEVASDVKVGSVDAGIVFDVVLHDFDTLDAVPIPELAEAQAHVGVAVIKKSRQPKQALHFARYLAASNAGLARYKEFGFEPVA